MKLADPAGTGEIKGPKTERGRLTRARLLDAAAGEFGEKGFQGSSIAGITQSAGVALGTFYVHFESKEAVFRALLAQMGRTTRAVIAERVKDAPDRLAAERMGIEVFIDHARANKNLYRIVMEAQFVAPDAYHEYYIAFSDAYRDNLRAAHAKGEIATSDEEVHAWALIGMSVFLGLRFAIWDDGRPSRDIAVAVSDLISNGLRPRAGKAE